MGLVRPHIEERLGLAEGAGNVVTSLVGIAMVDLREFGGIADKEQCRCHSNDRSYARSKTGLAADTNQGTTSYLEDSPPTVFLRQAIDGRQLRLLQIMPCDPEPSDGSPEGTWKDRERVEEPVINNLIDEL